MLRRGLVVTLLAGLFGGCRPAEPAASPSAPIRAIVDVGLEVTLDAGDTLILEDGARRHSPPPEALRRRVYRLERSLFRWHPPAPAVTRPGSFLAAPYMSSYPADRVVLRGAPAPAPGDRFVAFGATGRIAVLEATGETCPPDVEGCIVCADDDPERRHWARIVDGSLADLEYADALGPFAADEPLPSPRTLDIDMDARGRWQLSDAMDLDGDGAIDRLHARGNCSPQRRCELRETWRSHDGRWYAEPAPRLPEPPPMHALELLSWGDARLLSHLSSDEPIGGHGRVVAIASGFDNIAPVPGDYWILAAGGVVGRIRFSEDHAGSWCLSHGPLCHEAELVDIRPYKGSSQILFAGPISGELAVRDLTLPRRPRHATRWDPNRSARELALELSDGTRWTVTSRPCIEETPESTYHGICFETRIERPGATLHRHLTGSFRFGGPSVTTICRAL
ncbi:hypothetical protein [Nannocystis sp. SCPEA4]|uniref:hypothetical protein n=1 Tax=Nannocystis sp. SCPEA4 TaxID=2996787 RepID=UPI0022703336|nr:hypothetical protein [Nannocystis sp. SCPEA4]MCY1054613.1 hypothetical protein [Nannocystis sp. SCPEA4]